MTTLTERYVWAVLRAMPSSQRKDLEPEIRALVADTTESKAADGTLTTEAAERAALTELGDPEVLAGRYVDRTVALIGPQVYPEWRRLLTTLLPIVVPIVTIVVLAANAVEGKPPGTIIANGLGAAFNVTVQTAFWFTLVFALLERSTAARTSLPERTWSLDQLPQVPAPERLGIGEAVASVIANVFVAIALLWVMLAPPIVIDGQAYPLFDPALWSFWIPWFLVVTVAEVGFAVLLYLRGRWTYGLAAINAILGAAFAIPALYLLANDMAFNPALVEEVRTITGGTWLDVTASITMIVIAVIVAWDAFDGFRKAWLNQRSAAGTTAAPA